MPKMACHPPLMQHEDDEYGAEVGPDGQHHGGPFQIEVSPKMRVDDVRKIIRVSSSSWGKV